MDLKIKHFVAFITPILLLGCNPTSKQLSRIDAQQLIVDHKLEPNDSIETLIMPYRNSVNKVLDSTLAYAPTTISKTDGIYNTSAGNLMADLVLSEANPIFKARTGNSIDFVLLNHGGIRALISAGDVSARTAYEVMPFENTIVVVALSGTLVLELVDFMIQSKQPHPIAGIQITIDGNGDLKSLKIQGKPFSKNRTYFVATSNYLVNGGDQMNFFKKNTSLTDTDYLIRNAMIDYFKKIDTLKAVVDDRFYKQK